MSRDPFDELMDLLRELKAEPFWNMWYVEWPNCLPAMFPEAPPPGTRRFALWMRP